MSADARTPPLTRIILHHNTGPVIFSETATSAPTVVVDPTRTLQRMQGFGGSLTDSAATVLYRLSPKARTAAMRSLFDPATGQLTTAIVPCARHRSAGGMALTG